LNYETIDRQKIRQRLRQVLDNPLADNRLPGLAQTEDKLLTEEDAKELKRLAAGVDIYNVPLTSGHRLGAIIIRVKSILRKLLKPSLEQQVIYNTEIQRFLKKIRQLQTVTEQKQEQLKQDLLAQMTDRLQEAMALIEVQKQEIDRLKDRVDRLERDRED
jgi:hypothetical protein